MGELVAFRNAARPKRRRAKPGETAEILFFTGVRYVQARERESLLRRLRPRRASGAETRVQDQPAR